MRTLFIAAACALSLAATTAAHAADKGNLTVDAPWARASAGMANAGGGFVTITNKGAEADRLVAARADVSQTVELHTHVRDGEVMRMRQVDAIDVPAGQTVKLQPGSHHIMFIGLKAPLQEGSKFPLTLVFEKTGEVPVEVTVAGVGAMAPAGAPMQHGAMPHAPMHK